MLERRLGSLPKGLRELYEELYSHYMLQQDEGEQRLTRTIFALLLALPERRSPVVIQLACALPCDPEALPTKETILDLCFNLVVYDKSLDTFRFSHLSVVEFLETRKDEFSQRAVHDTVTASSVKLFEYCFQNLDFVDLDEEHHKVWTRYREILTSYAGEHFASTFDYILGEWTFHLGKLLPLDNSSESYDILKNFLDPDSRSFQKWAYLTHCEREYKVRHLDLLCYDFPNPMFIICKFELGAFFQDVLGKISDGGELERKNLKGKCAALYTNNLDEFRAFLDLGAFSNCSEQEYTDAIQLATRRNWFDIVQLFLQSDQYRRRVGSQRGCWLALKAAAQFNNMVVARHCATALPVLATSDDWVDAALLEACFHGSGDVAGFLLKKAADKSLHGWTWNVALNYAIREGHLELVRKLMDQGADLNLSSAYKGLPLNSGSPLAHAIGSRRSATAVMMLKIAIRRLGNGQVVDDRAVEVLFGNNALMLGLWKSAIYANEALYLLLHIPISDFESWARHNSGDSGLAEEDITTLRMDITRWLDTHACSRDHSLNLIMKANVFEAHELTKRRLLELVCSWVNREDGQSTLHSISEATQQRLDPALRAFVQVVNLDAVGLPRRALDAVLGQSSTELTAELTAKLNTQEFKQTTLRWLTKDKALARYPPQKSTEYLYAVMRNKISRYYDLGEPLGG